MATYYIKQDAAGGGTGTELSPFNSLLQAAPGGNFAGDTVLYLHPGVTIPAVFGGSWTLPAGADLTIRPYGSGDGRPSITFTGNGFLSQGDGSVDYQDVDFYGTSGGSAAIARTGGSVRIVNSDIHNFATSIKCGTGTVYIENVWCNKPSRNGVQLDAAADQAICSSLRAYNVRCTAATPTAQDLFVLHAGGYGICSDVIVDGLRIEALDGAYIESGFDIQEDFANVILRNFTIIGASQWGLVNGNPIKTARTYVFNTKTQMLANFTRESVGSGPEDINGGHCCFVIADGANNGLWQLTGNDPNVGASWTGPMTDAEFATAIGHRIYSGTFDSCVAAMQVQHPGTQIAAVNCINTTLGNWIGESSSGSGNILSIYPTAYDVRVMDCNLSSSNAKYPEIVSNGAGNIGVPSGNLLTSARSAVRVQALNSRFTQGTRLTMTGCIVRQRSFHTGPFIEVANADDLGDIVTNYNAFVDEDALRTGFAENVGVSKTFAQFKTANGNSDANSQYITTATALIDDECALLDGSPLIGAGVARSGMGEIPNVDINGEAVSSPPDIGADNYLSEAVTASLVPTLRRTLRALHSAGVSPVPDEVPGAVSGLTAGTVTAVSIAFTWTEESSAVSYELRHGLAGSGVWSDTTDTATGASGVVAGLDPGYSWDVQIRGVNGAGSGDWSASVTASSADGVWYTPQDSLTGSAGMPTMTERFTGATTNPNADLTAGAYTLLTDNGGAGGGVALVAVDDNTERRINEVMSLVGMASGEQRIIAFEASHEQSATQSFYWVYGCHSSLSSMYGLHVSSSDAITFTSRGLGSGTSTNTALTRDSGPAFGSYDGQGTYLIILSIRSTGTTTVDVEVRMVHDTVGTAVWTNATPNIDCSDGAGAASLPGITSGQTAAEFGGLMLAARMSSISSGSGLPEKLLGEGTGHTASIGTFQARKHATYSASRLDAAIIAADTDPDGWWLS